MHSLRMRFFKENLEVHLSFLLFLKTGFIHFKLFLKLAKHLGLSPDAHNQAKPVFLARNLQTGSLKCSHYSLQLQLRLTLRHIFLHITKR